MTILPRDSYADTCQQIEHGTTPESVQVGVYEKRVETMTNVHISSFALPTRSQSSVKKARMGTICLLWLSSMLLGGCVTPISLQEQTPQVSYQPSGKILISVIDERQRVKNGKDPTFIGRVHGTFGIPADWHVRPVLSTEETDKEKTLAEFLQHRIVAGLRESDWDTDELPLTSIPRNDQLAQTLVDKAAERLVVLVLNEWFFSINLNWVTAFNFDTNVDISVIDRNGNSMLIKNISDRDVVDEEASESPQNLILRAYREQLRQIFLDKDVKSALTRRVEQPASLPPVSNPSMLKNDRSIEMQDCIDHCARETSKSPEQCFEICLDDT